MKKLVIGGIDVTKVVIYNNVNYCLRDITGHDKINIFFINISNYS